MTQDWLVKDPLLGIKIVKKGKRSCLGSERRTTSPPEGSAGDVLKKAKIKHHASNGCGMNSCQTPRDTLQILSSAQTLIICRIQPRLKFFQNAM